MVGDNGDHTYNTTVAHMKVSQRLSETDTGQSKLSGDLQILITKVKKCSLIYEMTPKSLWG